MVIFTNDTAIYFTEKLFDLKDFTGYSNTLIETGCSLGDGVQRALDAGFGEVLSIEADRELFVKSLQRFQKHFEVGIIYGRSEEVLKNLLAENNKQLVFFLDAHPAGEGSHNHNEWVETKQNFQDENIKAELEIILGNYNKHIIIIDDMEGLNSFSQVYINMILKANNDYVFKFYDENLSDDNLYKNKILAAVV